MNPERSPDFFGITPPLASGVIMVRKEKETKNEGRN